MEVEQEMRLALEAGIPPDELVAPMAEALRGQGLESLADRILDAARRARPSSSVSSSSMTTARRPE